MLILQKVTGMKAAASVPGTFMIAAQNLIKKYFLEWGKSGGGPASDDFFSADATVNWNGTEIQGAELKRFFEKRSTMKFKIASYEVQPVHEYQPPFCLVVVTGIAEDRPDKAQFHSTFYVEIGEDGDCLRVHYHTIKFLEIRAASSQTSYVHIVASPWDSFQANPNT